jgi:hypothetical protein
VRNEIKQWLRVIVIVIIVQPLYSLASNIGTLTSFSPGTLIKSADVNGNFAAITTAVNSKQDAITGTCPTGQAISGVAAVGGALTCAPAGLAFGDSVTGNAATSGVTVGNAGSGAGLEGDNTSNGNDAFGLLGQITGTTSSADSAGVKGEGAGYGSGVWGDAPSGNGNGVYGTAEGAGIGVYGFASNGIGVFGLTEVAASAGVQAGNFSGPTGIALSLQNGYFQVAGAGANTSTTVFTVVLTGGGTTPAESDFSNPMTNGNPNLILLVVPNFAGTGVDTHAAAPYYDTTGKWGIYNIDGSAMPAGAGFTVLVIHP